MVKKLKQETQFKVEKKEKALYDKYGVPAVELAEDGEYFSAIKLIDKILKTNPKVEFALYLKASYLFNHVTENVEFPEITLENYEKIKGTYKKIKEDLEECISLLDKLLKINPKNKNAKELKNFIKENALKQAKKGLIDFKKIKLTEDAHYVCPYCHKEFKVKNGLQEKEREIECELCHKTFVSITGVVSVKRGRTNAAVQYGAEPISITLKMGKEENTVNFTTNFRFLVNKGDKISFIYKKGFLSSSYRTIPSYIYNWSANDVFRIS